MIVVSNRVASERRQRDKQKKFKAYSSPSRAAHKLLFIVEDLVRNTSLGAGLLVLQIKIPSGIHLLGSSGGGICFEFFFVVTLTSLTSHPSDGIRLKMKDGIPEMDSGINMLWFQLHEMNACTAWCCSSSTAASG